MGVVLKKNTQRRVFTTFVREFLALIFIFCLSFFFTIREVNAAVIIRPPNNLGLVGYWSFDEGRGTQASDLSGNGNDGTLSGATLPAWVGGRSKQALSFNSINGAKRVLSSSIAPITSTITMSAWIYPTSYPSERSTIMQGISPNSYYLSLASDGSLQTYWYGKSSQGYHSSGASTVPLNQWSHVVAVWSTSGPSVYVDGVLENSFTSTGTGVAATIINIGAESLSRQFNGTIDEVRIYNRALSETEVQSLYTNTRSTVVGVTPVDRYNNGLVGHWTFDGKHTTTTTAEDTAGDNDATIQGATPTRGVIGQALEFDGGDDYIDLPTGWGQGVDFSEMSAAAWVLTTQNSGVRGLLEGRGSDLHWEINNTNWRVRLSGLNYSAIVSQPPVNEWTHVAYTYNRGTGAFKYFVDGQQVFSSTGESGTSSFFSSGNTQIGDSNFGTRRWDGKIDDFRIYNRELSADEIVGLYSATSSSKMNSSTDDLVTSGLVGHWTFDGVSVGSGSVNDSSGNGNNGVLVGATQVAGRIREALQFDGVDDYVRSTTVTEISTVYTASAWIYPHKTTAGNSDQNTYGFTILSDDGTGYPLWLRAIGGELRATAFETGNGGVTTVGAGITDNNWHHVVVSAIKGGESKMYVNGELMNTWTNLGSSGNWSGNFYIGELRANRQIVFDGLIDDVRIYNRALTEEEITQLYSMGQ